MSEQLELEKPFEKAPRYLLADQWAEYIPSLFTPRQFLTLTSKQFVYAEVLTHRYRFLVGKVNKAVFGNNWYRHGEGISDVVGVEPQLRGVLHLHAVWDAPDVPYKLVHEIWNRISGYAWIEPVTAAAGVAHYVSKYSVKGGMVSTYLNGQKRALRFGLSPT